MKSYESFDVNKKYGMLIIRVSHAALTSDSIKSNYKTSNDTSVLCATDQTT
jgi:hypothetical protein